MNLYLPQNYFSAVLGLLLDEEDRNKISVKPASMLVDTLKNSSEKDDLFYVPTLSLLQNEDLFISKNMGIAFDGILSNSYLYFKPEAETFDSIYLRGDVSVNEIILSKILFMERYEVNPNISLDSDMKIDMVNKNYLIAGNDNLENNFITEGVSFSDQINSLLTFPYVEFVLVSRSEESLNTFQKKYSDLQDRLFKDQDRIFGLLKLNNDVEEYIKLNMIEEVRYNLIEEDVDAIGELLRLPYYHGIVKEMMDLKFI